MTDGELVRRVVAGETAAYGVLARRWFCRILAFCQARSSVGALHDAEDLAQDVLVRGYRNIGSLVEPDQFGPWLRGIARHACSDQGRDRKRQPQPVVGLEWQATSGTGMPFESACVNDERRAVLEQIASRMSDGRCNQPAPPTATSSDQQRIRALVARIDYDGTKDQVVITLNPPSSAVKEIA